MEGRIDRKDYAGYLSGVADGLNQGRQDTIAELEKIKAEIHKKSLGEWYVGRLDGKSENVTTIESIDRIIDKHISELKGETE